MSADSKVVMERGCRPDGVILADHPSGRTAAALPRRRCAYDDTVRVAVPEELA